MIIKLLRWIIDWLTPVRNISDASDIPLAIDTITVRPVKTEPSSPFQQQCIFPILLYGHGPNTRGKRSPWFKGFQFIEYEYNKATIEILKEKLDSINWKYAVVNDYLLDCYSNCLEERVQIIKHLINVPDNMEPLIIDQHANGYDSDWNNVTGTETWIADVVANREKRLLYASIFQKNMVKRHNSKDRGIKMNKKRRFKMLYDTPYLAFILEPEFYTNLDKAKYLDSSGKELQAGAVLDSLREINNL